jgi:hypothetical protein
LPIMDQWKQQQIDVIADALHELLSSPDEGVETALEAIDAAIDTWLDYFDSEREKWFQLKARLHR